MSRSPAVGDCPFRFNFIDAVEAFEKNRPGGYHLVAVGGVLRERYRNVVTLGFGEYSNV